LIVRGKVERVKRMARALVVSCAIAGALVPSIARADTPTVSAADKEKSRAAFRRGVGQLKAQDWAGARASFEEAWALVQHPSILLNLGIARLKTNDPLLAEQDLARFLAEDTGASADEQTAAKEALAEARTRLGTLHVSATPASAKIAIDGKPAAAAEERVVAGPHVVSAEAEGFTADRKNVDVPGGGEASVALALAAEKHAPPLATSELPPSRSSTRKVVGFSLAGVSAVAFVATGILGVRAISLSNDYGDEASEGFQDPDVKSRGQNARTFADVALVTGLVTGAAAAVLLLTNIGATRPKTTTSR
jgi:hypothetical protein